MSEQRQAPPVKIEAKSVVVREGTGEGRLARFIRGVREKITGGRPREALQEIAQQGSDRVEPTTNTEDRVGRVIQSIGADVATMGKNKLTDKDILQIKEAQSPEDLSEKLKDPTYLPTYEEIMQSFEGRTDEFHKFCEDKRIFEFYNREFIDSFSSYLRDSIRYLSHNKQGKVTIVEAGAGDGRLTYFLKEKMKEYGFDDKVEIVAIDDKSWEKEFGKFGYDKGLTVEELSAEQAVQKYQPDIVICSWMIPGVDLSTAFRQKNEKGEPIVEEYILIGEGPGGACGNDATWGKYDTTTGEYIVEGYERRSLSGATRNIISGNLGRNEFGAFRDGSGALAGYSRTFSFRKI